MTNKEDIVRRNALSPEGESCDTGAGERSTYHRDDPASGRQPAPSRSIQEGNNHSPGDDNPAEAKGDQRISRTKWPKDAAKRRAQLAEILPQALADYFGNVTVIAAKLNVPEAEVQQLVDESDDLGAEAVRSERRLDALLEDCLIVKALEEGSSADLRFLLERRDPSKWAKQAPSKGPRRELNLPDKDPASVLDKPK